MKILMALANIFLFVTLPVWGGLLIMVVLVYSMFEHGWRHDRTVGAFMGENWLLT